MWTNWCALLPRKREKGPEQRMEQRLSHQVEIEILRPAAQLLDKTRKLFPAHEALLSTRAGAEGAGEVADVCDFQIDAFEHKDPF